MNKPLETVSTSLQLGSLTESGVRVYPPSSEKKYIDSI